MGRQRRKSTWQSFRNSFSGSVQSGRKRLRTLTNSFVSPWRSDAHPQDKVDFEQKWRESSSAGRRPGRLFEAGSSESPKAQEHQSSLGTRQFLSGRRRILYMLTVFFFTLSGFLILAIIWLLLR